MTEALPTGEADEKVSYVESDENGLIDGVAPEAPVMEEDPNAEPLPLVDEAEQTGTAMQAITSAGSPWVSMPAGTRRIYCPRGKTGPSSGAAAFLTSISGKRRYRIRYEVMPEGNFDFKNGGKLPGLGGGTAPSGGSSATSGYSARLMWNAGGRLSFYFYRVTGGTGAIDTGGYGTHWMWAADAKLIKGRWNTIELYVDMDTGETVGWLNGVQKARQWLKYNYSTTDKMVFSAFFGGSGASYAASKNEYLSFRNMSIRPGG
ncbi:MAG: hypothetical protein JNK82_28460 [Myxococcaceae bacterium]|nr:hypothetical protein [Myxococcaceae bacterium]